MNTIDKKVIQAIKNYAKNYVPKYKYNGYSDLLTMAAAKLRVKDMKVVHKDTGEVVAKYVMKYGARKIRLAYPVTGCSVIFVESQN